MIAASDWRPVGVDALEPAALDAVHDRKSVLVIAGPGTGKTELLGQKAAYLLQTGLCPDPRRILAISFKRDAATNLRERVERRCGAAMARRLDSLTFDAFAKQLVDRFRLALPEAYALAPDYVIASSMTRAGFAELQASARNGFQQQGHPAQWAAALAGRDPNVSGIEGVSLDDYNKAVQSLCLHPLALTNHAEYLQLVQLRRGLTEARPSVGFAMIGRLAQAIVNAHDPIRRAIRATYGFVFLDEFQDTTSVQFGLIESIFAGSTARLTAVGDGKQRIMGWAGAKRDVFEAFEAAFLPPSRISLTNNYRSNARIVAVLNQLKAKIAPDEPDFVAVRPTPDLPPEKICAVLVADDIVDEAKAVAREVKRTIADGIDPRAIGLLVRQKAVDWEERIASAFTQAGIAFRNEDRDVGGAAIQDLMTESYSRIVVDLFELLAYRHGGMRWTAVMSHMAMLEGLGTEGDDAAEQALALRLDVFHRAERLDPTAIATGEAVLATLERIEAFIGLGVLQGSAPQYGSGDFFERIRMATRTFLTECAAAPVSWTALFDRYRGKGQVPLLTITKSKGLEYDLVVLMGLNDSEWWSFAKDPDEGHSNFFVAASRARERLLMTRCAYDSDAKIREIFQLLDAAGVPRIKPERDAPDPPPSIDPNGHASEVR